MRGRKPKPTILHLRHGTTNATRHRARLRGEPALAADPPDWMTPAQRELWRHAIRHAPPGLLKAIDQSVLAVWVAAAEQHHRAIMLQAQFDAAEPSPLLATAPGGQVVPSPYERIIGQAARRMLKAASALGFTPATRPHVGAGSGALEPLT